MANPNIVNVTAIYGNNSLTTLSNTSAFSIINNASGSNVVYKVNSIVVANYTGNTAADISVNIYSQDDLGGTAFPIASTITVPGDASLIVTDKTTSFYLKEDQSVGATAGSANALVVTASWEQISS